MLRHLKSQGKEPGGDDTSSMLRHLKSQGKQPGGDDPRSMLRGLKLEGQELESKNRYPTARLRSQIRKKMTLQMDPECNLD